MDRDQAYLLDILSSARLIWSYIEGVELDEPSCHWKYERETRRFFCQL